MNHFLPEYIRPESNTGLRTMPQQLKAEPLGIACLVALSFLFSISAAAQQGAQRSPAPRNQVGGANNAPAPAPGGASAAQTNVKGIWEPVNYPDDVQLTSVYFVSDKVGWASGKGAGGIIVHTTDGGEHWDIQLGDPKSNEPPFQKLHFLDQTHGWAVQSDEKLLRTSDGKNWEEAGSFAKFHPMANYAFTSPQVGFEIAGYPNKSSIFNTQDGGRSWKETFLCEATLQIQGLTKKTGCSLADVAFPSARTGYAVGGAYNGGFSVIAKTDDGGTTWRLIFASTDLETIDAVFFTDDTHGVIRLRDRKLFATEDGGQSWRGIPSSASGDLKFGDPEVGWSCKQRTCSFTTDGGQHWSSRDLRLPASVEDFSVPRRDKIFVVGDHGMVYRYRVVPMDYTAKDISDAPLLPAYGEPVIARLGRIRTRVRELQAKLGVPAGSANAPDSGAGGGSASVSGNAAQSGTQPRNQVFTSQIQPGATADSAPAGQGSGATGDFSQAPGAPPASGFSQGAAAGADNQNAASGATFAQDAGFSQDALSAPPSAAIQGCCAAQFQSLQTEVGGFSQQVPGFTGKFRNLNLLFIGMNMLNDLTSKARGIRDAFLAFKKAPDVQAASFALQDLSAKLENTSQAVTTGFQGLTASNALPAVTGGVGNFIQSAPTTGFASAPNAATPAAAPPQPAPAPAQPSPAAAAPANSAPAPKKGSGAADEINKALKKRLPF